MRVLFVGFNRVYVNRTLSVLLRAVQAYHAIDFFGPGFQAPDVVAQGPDRWMEHHGPYDLVLFESYAFEHDAVAERTKPFAGDCLHMTVSDFYAHGPALQLFVHRYPGPKVFIANWDVYAISERRVDELDNSGAFVCDCTMSRFTMAEKHDTFKRPLTDQVVAKGFLGGRGTDHWVTFIKARKNKVLEVPHAIGLEQTWYVPLPSRPERFTVPGTSYEERKRMYRFLTPAQRRRQLADRVKDKLYFATHDSLTPKALRELHSRYDGQIARSCLAYTSGSIYRSPVRKYFEIPALGTVPVGQVVEGFSELGFVDRHNFIVAETANDVGQVLGDYRHEEAQVIASRARALIIEKHSEPARGRQLSESFDRICAGTFMGSYWKDGDYRHH